MSEKGVYLKGVRFNCEVCGMLLKDCSDHNPLCPQACPSCQGDLKKIGIGNSLLGGAVWYKCMKCKKYFMLRRGELVAAQERDGFKKYT